MSLKLIINFNLTIFYRETECIVNVDPPVFDSRNYEI